MNRFQIIYIFLFILSIYGIVGNIELGQAVSSIWKAIFTITGMLTLGKIIYLGGK
jgi:hypothetical protein